MVARTAKRIAQPASSGTPTGALVRSEVSVDWIVISGGWMSCSPASVTTKRVRDLSPLSTPGKPVRVDSRRVRPAQGKSGPPD